MSDRSTKDAFTSKRERSHRNGNSKRLFASAKAREAEARIAVLKKKLEALQEKHHLEEEIQEKRLKEENEKRRRKEKEEAAERERHDIELWNELEEEARQESLAEEERRKIKEEERIDAILRMYPKCMVPKWRSFVADFDVKYCKFPSLKDFTLFMKDEEAEIDREGASSPEAEIDQEDATSPEAEIDQEDVSSPEVEKDAAPEEKEPAIEEKKTPPVVEALAREDGKKEDPVQEMLVPVESMLVEEIKDKDSCSTQKETSEKTEKQMDNPAVGTQVKDEDKDFISFQEELKTDAKIERSKKMMMDDSDESYDRPMSPGLRSRSPPHRARLKMPNEDKVDGLCVPRGADAQKDFGTLTRNVKLTTQEAAARGAPKTAKQKTFFVAQGACREERKTTLQAAATRRYVKKHKFKTGRRKAGRPPDRKVEPRGAKKSFRRREPQEVKKTPETLQKAVRRVLKGQYEKVYKDLKGKFKKVRSSVKKSSEVLLCGWPPWMQEAGIILMKKCTLYAQVSTTEIYDSVFCENANLRDTIFKGHEFWKILLNIVIFL